MQPNNPKDFTEKAWQVITRTLDVAKQAKHQQMETEHLLKSLLEQDGLASWRRSCEI
jgi:ATP-dependent Clp protease ATP-binding subunit ClpB